MVSLSNLILMCLFAGLSLVVVGLAILAVCTGASTYRTGVGGLGVYAFAVALGITAAIIDTPPFLSFPTTTVVAIIGISGLLLMLSALLMERQQKNGDN